MEWQNEERSRAMRVSERRGGGGLHNSLSSAVKQARGEAGRGDGKRKTSHSAAFPMYQSEASLRPNNFLTVTKTITVLISGYQKETCSSSN